MIQNTVMLEHEIRGCIRSLWEPIAALHRPILYIVLDGGFMFGANLTRETQSVIVGVDLISVNRGYETGKPHTPVLIGKPPIFLAGTTPVFVDVITETGTTFEFLKELVPESFRHEVVTIALVVKGEEYTPDFFGKRIITKNLLTGYGMGPHRELPYIAEIKEE